MGLIDNAQQELQGLSDSSTGAPGGMAPPSMDSTTVEDPTQVKLDQLLAKQPKSGGGGFLDTLKHVGGDLVGDAVKGLGMVAAVPVSLGNQLGNLGSAALGRNQDDPNYRPSFGQFGKDILGGLTAGQVVQQSHPDWSPWVKDVAGGSLDLASNPLNMLMPGTDAVAKEGLAKAGQIIGDAAAKDALKAGGVDALRSAVEERLAADAAPGALNAVNHGGAQTLEDVLGRGTQDTLGAKGTQDVVQSRLDALGSAKPGLRLGTGVLGHADIAVPGSARLGALGGRLASSDAVQAVKDLITPTAAVERDLGQGAADATSQATHTAAGAKMEAQAANATEGLAPGPAKDLIVSTGNKAMVDDLVRNAPEIAKTPSTRFEIAQLENSNWVQLQGTNTWVDPTVNKAFEAATSAPASKAASVWDKIMSPLKQYTVFNPFNAIQHNVKRATYNLLGEVGQNGLDFGAHAEGKAMYKTVAALAKDGVPVTEEALVAKGMAPDVAQRTIEGVHGILADNPMFEADKAGKGGVWGTRTAAGLAEKNTSISRLSVFSHALNEGLDPAAAAARARAGLLDFSNAGLTPFEREKLQRLSLFYKFPRRAIPAGISFAEAHPGEANLLSHVGLGVQQGTRNAYGEHVGVALDTPLEQAASGIEGMTSNPIQYALGESNPVIQALLDSKKQGVGDILPPVGMVQRHVQNVADASGPGDKLAALLGSPSTSDVPGAPGPGGIPLPGGISGEDYNQTAAVTKNDTGKSNFDASVAQKAAKGTNLTQRETLALLADKAGLPNPYGMTEAELLQALQAAGMDKAALLKAMGTGIPAANVLGSVKTK